MILKKSFRVVERDIVGIFKSGVDFVILFEGHCSLGSLDSLGSVLDLLCASHYERVSSN